MKLVSWNVNGLRAILGKGLLDHLRDWDADVVCLQEIKSLPEQVDVDFEGYHEYWHPATRKGYSGTLTLSKEEAITASKALGHEVFDGEGRVLTTEYEHFYLVNIYTPNSKRELLRLEERVLFEEHLVKYLCSLKEKKGVIVCGDLNVAHREIDLKNPKDNRFNPGFSDEERACFSTLLEAGFVDSFRHFYPEKEEAYTWWSYVTRARSRNAGWRIDYFLVSEDLIPYVKSAEILSDVLGSDHCPVELEIDFN